MSSTGLVDDDLIDDAPTRRGVPTANAMEGRAIAVLVGDLLLGAPGRLATSVSAEAGVLLQQTLIAMCAGQAVEAQARYDADLTAEGALAIAEAKTGALLGAACHLGALLAPEQDERATTALAAFGRDFGNCLQLLDDLLDLLSTDRSYGEPTGVDVAAGTVTLPAVRASRKTSTAGAAAAGPDGGRAAACPHPAARERGGPRGALLRRRVRPSR